MGALRQPRPDEGSSLRKPPKTETKAATSLERLRARTDYDTGQGWSALPHAAFVDLLKLSSGEVCMKFVLAVNIAMGSGSARTPKDAWDAWSDFRTSQEWADDTASNVRDIQRLRVELKERGMIAVKQSRTEGTIKYAFSLLYRAWGKLDSYAVWKRRQVVPIDEPLGDEAAEDEAPAEISKDAVILTKKPQRIAPGRASRAVPVNVGVSSFKVQSTDTRLDLMHSAVVQSGCLILSIGSLQSEAKSDDNANARRHVCRLPNVSDSKQTSTKVNPPHAVVHPRAAELVKLFDPILAASAARLLSGDTQSLRLACEAVQDCDHDFLVKFAVQRASAPVKSPLHVKTICTEALNSWRASKVLDGAGLKDPIWDEIEAQAQRERETLRLAREKARRK